MKLVCHAGVELGSGEAEVGIGEVAICCVGVLVPESGLACMGEFTTPCPEASLCCSCFTTGSANAQ